MAISRLNQDVTFLPAFRNLVINGAMQVAQRGTSATGITEGGYYTADRWNEGITTQGTWTISVENDAPTGSGFSKSLKWLCTTADASPASGDNLQFFTTLEGQNLQQMKKGTAAAEQLTLSFWVKSNVTGTYVAELYDADNTRQTSKQYTISASGTWEYKTITFAADTTGAFDNDNALSLYVVFGLGAGSNFTSGTLQTSWATATTANRFVGQVNLASATSNYWQITGVQLEVGAVATPFEFKPIGQELAECQRYYFRNTPGTNEGVYGMAQVRSTTQSQPILYYPTSMRSAPTALEFSNIAIERAGHSTYSITAMTIGSSYATPNSAKFNATTGASGASLGECVNIVNDDNASGFIAISAEL